MKYLEELIFVNKKVLLAYVMAKPSAAYRLHVKKIPGLMSCCPAASLTAIPCWLARGMHELTMGMGATMQ